MKIKIFIVMAITACLSFAQSELAKPAPREHRGFYSNTSFSLAYNWYKASLEDVDEWGSSDGYGGSERVVDYFEFYGGSFPMFEFKFGTALADLVALYSVFNIGFHMGVMDWSYKKYYKDCLIDEKCEVRQKSDEESSDAYSFRSYIGFGSTFYPFRDKNSGLNGFFIGGSVGYTVFATVIIGGEENACGNAGPGFELELGKDWWVNDHLSIGVGLGFAHSSLVWNTVSSHSSDNVISIAFRMTRG